MRREEFPLKAHQGHSSVYKALVMVNTLHSFEIIHESGAIRKMKILIVAVLVASVYADVSHLTPKTGEANAQILRLDNDVGQEGQYAWAIETDNGIAANEQGALKAVPGSDVAAETVQGAASWKSPEGELVQLTYTADENGYRPEGSHIPTAPPIPPAILRALEWIAAHPPPVEKN